MPRATVDDSQRMNLRVPPEVKSRLARAASLNHVDLTSFVTQAALRRLMRSSLRRSESAYPRRVICAC